MNLAILYYSNHYKNLYSDFFINEDKTEIYVAYPKPTKWVIKKIDSTWCSSWLGGNLSPVSLALHAAIEKA
jgi:hypothetical protein